ncbi:MAG: flagellar hook-associated protein FlgL [Aquificota bacterium]|nr:flagellar hook-associated protein FlgL [Aquificota bacterium]
MKVPDSLLFSIFQRQDARIRQEIARKTIEIATGRRIHNISDDPPATLKVLNLKKEIAQLSQFSRNRLFADVNLTYTDMVLGKMADRVKEVYTKVVQAKNEIHTEDSLKALGVEIREALDFLLDMANEKVGDNYIFSGTALTTKPFNGSLTYMGSEETFRVQIGEGNFVPVFRPGGEVFSTNVYELDTLYASPDASLGASGTLTVSYDSTTFTVDYGDGVWYLTVKVGDPDAPLSAYGVGGDLLLDGNVQIADIGSYSLNDLVNAVNSDPDFAGANITATLVANPDGTYTLKLVDSDGGNTLEDTDRRIKEANTPANLVDVFNTLSPPDLRAYLHRKPDGRYTLRLIPENLSTALSLSFSGTALGSFYTLNVFQIVDEVGRKLREGLSPDESDLKGVQRSYDKIASERSETGSVLSQVKSLEDVQENRMDSLRKQKSDEEDAELSESIMEYTRYRIAYEALMRIVADTRDMTILRYI